MTLTPPQIKDRPNGRGSAGYTRGERITSPLQLKVGDLLIEDKDQFNTTNVVEITELDRWPHAVGEICYGNWFTGSKQPSSFALWFWEFEYGDYYRACLDGQPVNIMDEAKAARVWELSCAVHVKEPLRIPHREGIRWTPNDLFYEQLD